MKTLKTGVVITYDKQGNIKTLFSPYYDKKENNPVRGTILSYLHNKLKQLIR